MSFRFLRGCVLAAVFVLPSLVRGDVITLDDIQFWAGSGANRAAMVIDWNDGRDPLAWGYRWDGTATGEDMARALAEAHPYLFAKIVSFSFGNAMIGAGYDRDADGFSLDDGTVFIDGVGDDPDGSTDAVSNDPDDSYGEGFNTGYFGYWLADSSPFDGGIWEYASVGFSDRVLADGSWDGWSYAPGFADSEPDQPIAAVPEPASFILFGLGLLVVAEVARR